ncbi:MAG: hypothetical protein ABJC07_04175 [Acidobacteriota bacterium]
MFEMVPQVQHVVDDQVFQACRLGLGEPLPAELVEVMPGSEPAEVVLADGPDHAGELKVVKPPERDEVGPRRGAIRLDADPRILLVAGKHEVFGKLRTKRP